MIEEFKKFIMRGNVVDLAVGVVIGVAFGAIIKSFTDDLLMPVIGLLMGGTDFTNLFVVLRQGAPSGPYATLDAAKTAGAVTWRFGLFLNSLMTFTIVAAALFMMIRTINRLAESPKGRTATTKPCPECAMTIPLGAKRCPYCTSSVG
ncbi:MAG: large conductance mechanosensitive channel protein MscL [Euryarchaeota archaeon]|nr:large conductance mechanosensitive channel protein MscL [Euryarchaeota archaeon]